MPAVPQACEHWTNTTLPIYLRTPAADSGAALTAALFQIQNQIVQSNASNTEDSLPELVADPVQLITLFANLISNSIKFRKTSEAPRLHITAVPSGPYWHFSVQDNGIGIPPKHFESVFRPFKRLHGGEIRGKQASAWPLQNTLSSAATVKSGSSLKAMLGP